MEDMVINWPHRCSDSIHLGAIREGDTVSEWLHDLKEGDEVIVSPHFGNSEIKTVSRVTKTLIIVGSERFSKRWGQLVGTDIYFQKNLIKTTPEKAAIVKERNLRNTLIRKIENHNLSKVSTDDLMKAWEILEVSK